MSVASEHPNDEQDQYRFACKFKEHFKFFRSLALNISMLKFPFNVPCLRYIPVSLTLEWNMNESGLSIEFASFTYSELDVYPKARQNAMTEARGKCLRFVLGGQAAV